MLNRLKLPLLAASVIFVPSFVFASAIINEVLFDPAGSDTGLEKIEIYNPDGVTADLGGWELYPDGIGYLTFPSGFSLASKSFAAVHLRMSGADDSANLYHISAGANMGNSSGSIALFKPGGRSKDTIVDFLRYQKPGSSERKTWESAAAEAGLWTVGTFIDVSVLEEGNSIGLSADGARGNTGSYRIYSPQNIGGPNGAGNTPSSQNLSGNSSTTAKSQSETVSSGYPPKPGLGADAGSDVTAAAGTLVQFRGTAFGLDGESMPGARFLWNFGDGTVEGGRSLAHVYHFPGTYHVNLTVSSGEYSGSDWRTVTVLPQALAVSEVKPGNDGFVELFNAGGESIDLGGINFTDDANNVFSVPPNTTVGAERTIVFPNAVSRLNPVASLTMRDARLVVLDAVSLPLSEMTRTPGASYEKSGNAFLIQPEPTPGRYNANTVAASAEKKSLSTTLTGKATPLPQSAAPVPNKKLEADYNEPVNQSTQIVGKSAIDESGSRDKTASVFLGFSPAKIYFVISVVASLALAAAFVLLKRKMV